MYWGRGHRSLLVRSEYGYANQYAHRYANTDTNKHSHQHAHTDTNQNSNKHPYVNMDSGTDRNGTQYMDTRGLSDTEC